MLQHRAKEVPTTTQGRKKEQQHLKTAVRRCGYPDWAFSETSRKRDPKKAEGRTKRHGTSVPYLSGVSEKFRRTLQKERHPGAVQPLQKPQKETGPPQGQNTDVDPAQSFTPLDET